MELFPKLNNENTVKSIFLYLTITAAAFMAAPYLDLQTALSQGDHGRDLYAFERILHGEKPYRDFWWVYGPLMPYYYAAFMKAFGVTILSVIVGKLTLMIFNAVLMYLILLPLSTPVLAFLGACYAFTQQSDFFFTFNHIGGLTLILSIMLGMIRHFTSNKSHRSPWALLILIFALASVKLNFGVTSLIMVLLGIAVDDRIRGRRPTGRIGFYLSALIGVPIAAGAAYGWFLQGLTWEEIRQCLPFLPGDQPHEFPLSQTVSLLMQYLKQAVTGHPFNLFICVTAVLGVFHLSRRPSDNHEAALRQKHLIIAGFLLGLTILNLHEFLRSNVWYRLAWAQPSVFALIFLLIAVVISSIKPLIRRLLLAALAVLCFFQGAAFMYRAYAWPTPSGIDLTFKTADHYLDHPRGKVYLGLNSSGWIQTVLTTSDIIDRLTAPEESFLALPYDPIYYYLAGQKSPTRQLIFFDHIHITPRQEKSIIAELEANKTNWILLSSRMFSHEYGLGIFGKTYSPALADYIYQNYHVIDERGDWAPAPGWTDAHGVRILKRDKPL